MTRPDNRDRLPSRWTQAPDGIAPRGLGMSRPVRTVPSPPRLRVTVHCMRAREMSPMARSDRMHRPAFDGVSSYDWRCIFSHKRLDRLRSPRTTGRDRPTRYVIRVFCLGHRSHVRSPKPWTVTRFHSGAQKRLRFLFLLLLFLSSSSSSTLVLTLSHSVTRHSSRSRTR